MGEILLRIIERAPKHRNTIREYSREIREDRYRYILGRMSESIRSDNAVYIFGMGKHPKSTYLNLKNSLGLEVVWYGSLIPKYLTPLRMLISSYEGIVRVLDVARIKDVFETLSRMSMVGLYVFNKNLEERFVQTVKSQKYSKFADEVVKEDTAYFIYQVDADSSQSSTGILEIVSYGKDCPKAFTGILELS